MLVYVYVEMNVKLLRLVAGGRSIKSFGDFFERWHFSGIFAGSVHTSKRRVGEMKWGTK